MNNTTAPLLTPSDLSSLPFLFRCTNCNVRDEISRTCLCRGGGSWVQTDQYRNSDAGRAQRKADQARIYRPLPTVPYLLWKN